MVRENNGVSRIKNYGSKNIIHKDKWHQFATKQ